MSNAPKSRREQELTVENMNLRAQINQLRRTQATLMSQISDLEERIIDKEIEENRVWLEAGKFIPSSAPPADNKVVPITETPPAGNTQ